MKGLADTDMISLLIKYVGCKLAAETSSVDVLISLVGAPGFHDSTYFEEVARVLKPGGKFVVQEPATLEEKKVSSMPSGIDFLDVRSGHDNLVPIRIESNMHGSSSGVILLLRT